MKTPFKQFFAIGLVLVSAVSLIMTGIVGVGRGGPRGYDFVVLYAAGRAWLQGLNPYVQSQLVQAIPGGKGLNPYFQSASAYEMPVSVGDAPFSYPPPFAAFLVPLGLLSYPMAEILWVGVNFLALVGVVALTIWIINRHEPKFNQVGSALMASFILGNPVDTSILYLGQTSLVSLVAMMGAWILNDRQKWLWAGICLGVSMLKPNLCIFVLLWFLLERNWRVLLTASLTTGALSLYPLWVNGGPIAVGLSWLERLKTHTSYVMNLPGSEHTIGIQNFSYAAGIKIPDLTLLGVALVVLVYFFRDRFSSTDIFAILMATMLLFVFNMNSAYVCIIPVLAALWLHCRRDWRLLLINIPLFCVFSLPRSVFVATHTPVFMHWRAVVVSLFLLILLSINLARRVNNDPPDGSTRSKPREVVGAI